MFCADADRQVPLHLTKLAEKRLNRMSYDEAIMMITLSQGGESMSGHLFATDLGNGNLFPRANALAFDDGIS